jgi:hypothetical protein
MWNIDASVKHLNQHAKNHSLGRCAEFVRKAVEAGGVTLKRHTSAKDYGSSLSAVGFRVIASDTNLYKAGDVAIVQPIVGHPHGHMVMFNGKIWISDFIQNYGIYPGPSYRKIKPPFKVYRHESIDSISPVFLPTYSVDTFYA